MDYDAIYVKDDKIILGNEILAEGKEAERWAVKAGYNNLEDMRRKTTMENKDQKERLNR